MIKQVWVHYLDWEDYKAGMWRRETKEYEEENFQAIIDFTGNHKKYGKAMNQVIKKWPFSCQQNLTNPSINQKAWLGHAACCLAFGYPEYLVRIAWGNLTDKQRIDANLQAEKAITKWKKKYEHILKLGSKGVISKEYQMWLQTSLKQMVLFRHTEE